MPTPIRLSPARRHAPASNVVRTDRPRQVIPEDIAIDTFLQEMSAQARHSACWLREIKGTSHPSLNSFLPDTWQNTHVIGLRSTPSARPERFQRSVARSTLRRDTWRTWRRSRLRHDAGTVCRECFDSIYFTPTLRAGCSSRSGETRPMNPPIRGYGPAAGTPKRAATGAGHRARTGCSRAPPRGTDWLIAARPIRG